MLKEYSQEDVIAFIEKAFRARGYWNPDNHESTNYKDGGFEYADEWIEAMQLFGNRTPKSSLNDTEWAKKFMVARPKKEVIKWIIADQSGQENYLDQEWEEYHNGTPITHIKAEAKRFDVEADAWRLSDKLNVRPIGDWVKRWTVTTIWE